MNAWPLCTENTNAYSQDTGLAGCFTGWQICLKKNRKPAHQRNVNVVETTNFAVATFLNLTRLDDIEESVFILEQ